MAIGDRGEALRAHQEYESLLAREFGTGPAADTVRWVDALFAKYPAPPPSAGRVGEDGAPADTSEWRLEQDPRIGGWRRGVSAALWTAASVPFALWIAGSVTGSPSDAVILQTDASASASAAAEAILEMAASDGPAPVDVRPPTEGSAGLAGWVSAWLDRRDAGYRLRLFQDERSDSLRVELSGLQGLPGRILSHLAFRVPEEDRWVDLADRALGLVVVQVSDDPLPWREAVGHAPRYSAVRAFVQAHEAWELRVDRQGRMDNLRTAVIADPSFLLAWFELAARAPGASISDSTIWVPNGPDTLRLPLNTDGGRPELERRLEGIAGRPLTTLERSVWLAAARRHSRVQALGHWRDAGAASRPRYTWGEPWRSPCGSGPMMNFWQ